MKRTAMVVFALAAGLVASADESTAPLAGAKQQLQQLQKDEASPKSGSADSGLKGALPELKTSVQGHETLPSLLDPNQNPRDKGHKHDAKKNWLVDGYDRLDPKSTKDKTDQRTASAGSDSETDDKDEETSRGDQDDLIKLYEKQGDAREATAAKDKQSGDKAPHATAPDPLAPFLQGWLANSPVRDAALSSIPRTDSGAGTALPAPASAPLAFEGSPSAASVGGNPSTPASSTTSAENPYLLALTLPLPTENPSASAPAMLAGGLEAFPNGPEAKPAASVPLDSLLPPARAEGRKPPMTPADEDKKYFPQLKRF